MKIRQHVHGVVQGFEAAGSARRTEALAQPTLTVP